MFVSHIKKHPVAYGVAAVVLVGVIFVSTRPEDPTSSYDSMTIARGDIRQEVEVTGKVRPAEDRDLAFQRSGIVTSVLKRVGDAVERGDRIVALDASELQAQLLQARASIEQEENTLVELRRGSRPEEIALSETAVANAERSLDDAQESLELTKAKAETDIASVYDTALTTSQSSVITAKNALVVLSTLQYDRFISSGASTEDFSALKGVAVYSLFNVNNAEDWTPASISELGSGVYGSAQALTSASPTAQKDQTFSDVLEALRDTSEALGAMPILSSFNSTEKADLAAQRTAVSSAITSLASAIQSISVQKSANTSAIAAAEAAVTTAENVLSQTQNELTLKLAGSSAEAIATQESRVRSAYAQEEFILSQIRSMTLFAPISGVVTKQDAETGMFVQAGAPVVSLISSGGFEIETYVPEVDIAKVSVGDIAQVTLDAYDDSEVFAAQVSAVDPGETVIEGVSTYKVTILFDDPEDARIRSGMTADVTMITDTKEDVLFVPTRAVVREGGKTYVRKVQNDGTYELSEVKVGLRGTSGNTEILEGVTEGESVVTFIRE